MLEIKNIYKSYDKTEVLHGISLTVQPGEIHGLIGENSAGKSTLIKCATGIYKPDSGSILLDSKPVYDNPQAKLIIGYVADYNEYISFYSSARMAKMYADFYPSFDTEKFNSLNSVFEIPLEKAISSLSKGQKMRLAIMLEVAKCPQYLILDEPTSGLDPIAKEEFYKLLIEQAEEHNVGILISSHNLAGLERLCDSITLIHCGNVEKQLSLDDMKNVLSKINVVFENDITQELLKRSDILNISNIGSIYTLIIKDYSDKTKQELLNLGASFIESVSLSLEELFITMEKDH